MFNFFKLPRELRDAIYDLLTVDICKQSHGLGVGNPKATVKNGPIRKLLTLNRQFTSEYQDCVDKAATLKFTDYGSPHNGPHIEGNLRQLHNVELHLGIGCYSDECVEMGAHQSWTINMLNHLPDATNLRVNIYVQVGETPADYTWAMLWRGEDFREQLSSYIKAARPENLAVFTCSGRERDVWGKDKRMRVEWTEREGYVEHE